MGLSNEDFNYIRELVLHLSGIVIHPDKHYFVASRLKVLAYKVGFDSEATLINTIRNDPRQWKTELKANLVEALVTRETSFFRDNRPFLTLKDHIFPDLIRERAAERTLYIWSAACSTGQEPYSIAMLIRENFPSLLNWDLHIHASDISEEALVLARTGTYSSMEIKRGLSPQLLERYFDPRGTHWTIKDSLKQMVNFSLINLIEPYPQLPSMNIIFLRNVLIYFDNQTVDSILYRITQIIQPGGYLFIDVTKSADILNEHFNRIDLKSGCYQLKTNRTHCF